MAATIRPVRLNHMNLVLQSAEEGLRHFQGKYDAELVADLPKPEYHAVKPRQERPHDFDGQIAFDRAWQRTQFEAAGRASRGRRNTAAAACCPRSS